MLCDLLERLILRQPQPYYQPLRLGQLIERHSQTRQILSLFKWILMGGIDCVSILLLFQLLLKAILALLASPQVQGVILNRANQPTSSLIGRHLVTLYGQEHKGFLNGIFCQSLIAQHGPSQTHQR